MFQFDDWLERLVEEKGDDLYRMKGILSVSDSEQRYVFQVYHPYSVMLEYLKNIKCLFLVLVIISKIVIYQYFLFNFIRRYILFSMGAPVRNGNLRRKG